MLFLCIWVWMCTCHDELWKVQLAGMDSLLPVCRLGGVGSRSGGQAWWQAVSCTEPPLLTGPFPQAGQGSSPSLSRARASQGESHFLGFMVSETGDKRLLSMALFLSGQLAPWAVEQKARKGFSGFREFLKRQGLHVGATNYLSLEVEATCGTEPSTHGV